MHTPNPRRLVASALAIAVLLTGCSGSDDSPSELSPTTETSAAQPEEGRVPPETAVELPPIPELADARGIRGEVELTTCATEGPLEASGEVTNAGDVEVDIVVTVSWTGEGSRILARGVATLTDVDPSDTVTWSVDSEAPSAPDLTCVVNAQAGTLVG